MLNEKGTTAPIGITSAMLNNRGNAAHNRWRPDGKSIYALRPVRGPGRMQSKDRSASSALEWPAVGGDYEVGSPDSPVAIVVIGRGDLPLDPSDFAIKGTMKTENMGLEKVVVNIISNPRIRYVIVCGKEEFGHFPSDAISHLWKDGMDDRGRIIGARSAIPYLCNIPPEAVARFREQVELIDLVDPKEAEEIVAYDPLYRLDSAAKQRVEEAIDHCIRNGPGRLAKDPLVLRPPGLMVDAKKAVKAIDTLALEFTNQMLRLPSERISTEASLISISEPLGIVMDPLDGKVFEVPSVEFAAKLKSYYRGGR